MVGKGSIWCVDDWEASQIIGLGKQVLNGTVAHLICSMPGSGCETK